MPASPKLHALRARFESLLHEVAKFGVVGFLNFALDVSLFNVLRLTVLDSRPLTAKAIATAVAATSSYFMNRHWTWRNQARTGLRRELPLFLVLSGVGLGITEVCLAFSHYALGLRSVLADNISANGVGLVLGMAWRFWSFKRWVFLAPESPAEPVPTPGEAAARTSV